MGSSCGVGLLFFLEVLSAVMLVWVWVLVLFGGLVHLFLLGLVGLSCIAGLVLALVCYWLYSGSVLVNKNFFIDQKKFGVRAVGNWH